MEGCIGDDKWRRRLREIIDCSERVNACLTEKKNAVERPDEKLKEQKRFAEI